MQGSWKCSSEQSSSNDVRNLFVSQQRQLLTCNTKLYDNITNYFVLLEVWLLPCLHKLTSMHVCVGGRGVEGRVRRGRERKGEREREREREGQLLLKEV